ncbi:MAG: prepilin-type N-terminal cleavage/methylation domain-containing protein [Halothiobacillaceae bacterium]
MLMNPRSPAIPSRSPKPGEQGVTLVELMIGLMVGLIVIAVVGTVFLSALRGSSDTLAIVKLNQQLRGSLGYLSADLRRAGYWAGSAEAASDPTTPMDNPFTRRDAPATDIQIHAGGQCLMFSYDFDHDGDGQLYDEADPAAAPLYGYRLADGNLQAVVPGTELGTDGTASCDGALFEDLTDPGVTEVTSLAFSTAGSRCHNLDEDSTWTAPAGSTIPACDPATAGYDATAGDRMVEVRRITITLTGRHAHDDQVTMTLTDTVKIRNNRIVTAEASP